MTRSYLLLDCLLVHRYGPGGWSGGFTIAATTYLDDVQPGGGCFYFFPNSHRAVHQFFLRNPEQIDGSFYIRQDVRESVFASVFISST